MSTTDVTNPGVVNVSDQADGPTSVDQCVTVGPSQVGARTVAGTGAGPQVGVALDGAVSVTPPMTARSTVDGGLESPTSGDCINTTENTVVNQTYGTGSPSNVYV
jgi:hypothetical protein